MREIRGKRVGKGTGFERRKDGAKEGQMQMGLKGEKEQESWGLGGGNGKRREQGSGRKSVQKRWQRL